MQSNQVYALIMLAAGIGIPVMAALNSQLGVRLGSPVAAAVVVFCVALVTSVVVLFALDARPILKIASVPPHLTMAGLFVAFYILSITFIAPHFGIGNAVFFVLLGQLISAALIDHFGLFGARVSPVSFTRLSGIVLMSAGVFLTQKT